MIKTTTMLKPGKDPMNKKKLHRSMYCHNSNLFTHIYYKNVFNLYIKENVKLLSTADIFYKPADYINVFSTSKFT